MPTYACHDGKNFIITITASNKTEAESLTGLSAVKTAYKKPWVGWTIDGEIYKSPQPFYSWIWNGESWQAPIEKPIENNELYYWNEAEKNWKLIEQDQPYPSWIVDEYNGNWIAPKPKPENWNIINNPNGSVTVEKIEEDYIWDENIKDWKLVN